MAQPVAAMATQTIQHVMCRLTRLRPARTVAYRAQPVAETDTQTIQHVGSTPPPARTEALMAQPVAGTDTQITQSVGRQQQRLHHLPLPAPPHGGP